MTERKKRDCHVASLLAKTEGKRKDCHFVHNGGEKCFSFLLFDKIPVGGVIMIDRISINNAIIITLDARKLF